MKRIAVLAFASLTAAAVLAGPVSAWIAAQTHSPLRVFLRGGPKTHGPAGNGLHDHEVWVKEWTPLLASRGAKVDGGLQFPTAA